MVQLYNGHDLQRLMGDYEAFGLAHISTVSERFNIYLLRFDTGRTSADDLIRAMQLETAVANAQGNHSISLRELNDTMPDDPFFELQWALHNTGQNGGTADADIDAPEAWDFATGGITAHGDTIVIAIIDGGSDLNHEDLDFWKNTSEIPGNGIDDDTNGFVDDYDGWNAYVHSGYIPPNSHGVHVAGIAGARGDNGKGISGVNWNVKILPIAGESTNEATVVEALSYIYVLRERYDETDGAEGAFIVADNCSFGVDEGQPEDYPIWEAMYDSLGQLGIPSVGATANKNTDIDVVGDIPTAFGTDYLISVTNTTNKDLKSTSAAYGDTAIDLGAPGTIIQSLLPGDKYGTKTGTSMAAPHVTGAIALLYSLADSTFISAYKGNPGVYALSVKQNILAGTDTLEDLAGKTVTGGRLNLFKAMQSFLNQPVLAFSPDSLFAGLLSGDTGHDTLHITNAGSDTLNYLLSVDEGADWLTMNKMEGSLAAGQSDTIVLEFNSMGLDTGTYITTLHIEPEGQEVAGVAVQMMVYDDVGVHTTPLQDVRVNVFPNPFSGYVTFEIAGNRSDALALEIYDQTGKQRFEKTVTTGGDISLTWQDAQAQPGIYYYVLRVENAVIRRGKLVKM